MNFLVNFFFLGKKTSSANAGMWAKKKEKGVFRSVIVFLCGLWYPACISRQAFANVMSRLQVKVFLIHMYRRVFYAIEKALSSQLL